MFEQFADKLAASGLYSRDDAETIIAAVVAESGPDDETGLSAQLVSSARLTSYQAAAIRGETGDSVVLGNYELLERLGRDALGDVYRARHRRMKRLVTLKLLEPSPGDSQQSEAVSRSVGRSLAQLEHTNLVAAYDAGQADGRHFLVMQHAEGEDLETLVGRDGPLPVDEAVDVVVQVADGLSYAHERDIFHGDLRPADVLRDERGTVKVLNLGLRELDRVQDDGPSLDVSALGTLLWFLLTGTTAPSDGRSPSSEIPDAPDELKAIVDRLVTDDGDRRFASMSEVLAALVPFTSTAGRTGTTASPPVAGLATGGTNETDPQLANTIVQAGARRDAGRSRQLIVAALLLCVIAPAIVLGIMSNRDRGEPVSDGTDGGLAASPEFPPTDRGVPAGDTGSPSGSAPPAPAVPPYTGRWVLRRKGPNITDAAEMVPIGSTSSFGVWSRVGTEMWLYDLDSMEPSEVAVRRGRKSQRVWYTAPSAASPDGRYLAQVENVAEVGSDAELYRLVVWDLKERRVRTAMRLEGEHFAWRADGEAVLMHDGTRLRAWSLDGVVESQHNLPGDYLSFACSPDGRLLAMHRKGMLELYSQETFERIREWECPGTYNYQCKFSPDGRQVSLESGWSGTVPLGTGYQTYLRVYDVEDGREVSHELEGIQLVWLPDGERIALPGRTHVGVFSAQTGERLNQVGWGGAGTLIRVGAGEDFVGIPTHQATRQRLVKWWLDGRKSESSFLFGRGGGVAWNDRGELAVSECLSTASLHGGMFDIHRSRAVDVTSVWREGVLQRQALSKISTAPRLRWTSSGNELLGGELGPGWLWGESGDPVVLQHGLDTSMAPSPTQELLAVADSKVVEVRKLDGTVVASVRMHTRMLVGGWSRDGKSVYLCGSRELWQWRPDVSTDPLSTNTPENSTEEPLGSPLQLVAKIRSGILDLDTKDDGSMLVAWGWVSTHLIDLTSGSTQELPIPRPKWCAWQPHGDLLAVIDSIGRLVFLNRDGEVVRTVDDPRTRHATRLAWSPDGRRFATVGMDGLCRIWTADAELLTTSFATPEGRGLTFSADGTLLHGDPADAEKYAVFLVERNETFWRVASPSEFWGGLQRQVEGLGIESVGRNDREIRMNPPKLPPYEALKG